MLVSSVTYAIKGRDLLLRHGLRAFVQRVPKTAETGCGYALYVPQYPDTAERILVENGVRVLGRIGDDSG